MRFYSDVVKNKCNLYREWKAHIKRSSQITPFAQSFPWASSSRCWSSWLNPSHHLAFLHCVLSNVSSNCLLQKSIFTIEASLDFFSLFSNEISNWSPQWKYFFICCINLAFLHYVLSNVIKCLLKLPSTIKAYSQSKHFFGLSSLNVFKWNFKLVTSMKVFLHLLHLFGFSPLCIIKCLLKLPSNKKAYSQSKHFLDYLHWMFSNEISNWSPQWMYFCICCIYLAFLHYVLSYVSSNCLLQKKHIRNRSILGFYQSCVFKWNFKLAAAMKVFLHFSSPASKPTDQPNMTICPPPKLENVPTNTREKIKFSFFSGKFWHEKYQA